MYRNAFWVLTLFALVSYNSQALAKSQGPPAATPEEAAAAPAPGSQPPDVDRAEEPDRDEDPMGNVGLGLKFGYLSYGEGDFETEIEGQTIKTVLPSRSGAMLSVPLSLGGKGFGWAFEFCAGLGDELSSLGLYTGPSINIHVAREWYVSLGLGARLGYITADGVDIGADFYGRIPISATYYVIDDLGIVAELGFGYGATGIKWDTALVSFDPVTGEVVENEAAFNLGTAFQFDFSMGVRWP